MHWLKFVISLVVTCALIVILNIKIAALPPLGKFLDPIHGFWRNTKFSTEANEITTHVTGLEESVTILLDDRQIPHIFAENEHDLYFAQGYVTAQNRLWQMEFQTHAAAGRLSEIIGRRALEYDRFQRRIGMVYGAEKALQFMQANSKIKAVVQAYTDGVNAYIESLTPAEYPLEYKILDYEPEAWTPLKCALLLKYMAWMLTGRSSDLQMSNTLARFGPEVMDELFPHYPANADPVIPVGTPWNFSPIKLKMPQHFFTPKIVDKILPLQADAANGSNNWAVSGKKTASGYPILSNDPHLELNLPSIWYELQLVAPGVNVYGVTLPGSPNVIIGFNENIAWGVTNSQADVMDWYEIQFQDSTMNAYWYDGKWQATQRRIEIIQVRGGETVVDTVVFTHHGPVPYLKTEKPFSRQVPPGYAVRWLGHDPTSEALAFYKLNRAQNYDDYVAALADYGCPAQNFAFADKHGDIALWHNGKFPAKWRNQGKYIGDGSDPRYDWQAWIPHEQKPHIKNPERGFVSSANQNATDPSYPYFLSWRFASSNRGHRINQLLSNMEKITPDAIRRLQLDTRDLQAEALLPTLLDLVERENLSASESAVLKELHAWNFHFDADKLAPTIFDLWWNKLFQTIWQDEFGGQIGYLRYPSGDRTIQMITKEHQAEWFDDVQTEPIETLAELVNRTFKAAFNQMVEERGEISEKWQWGQYKGTDILHLARIPGLGRMDLDVGGDLGIVNATGRRHGPSWRMVVAFEPEVKAWGIYPGGQSGNPGSPHYDDFIESWVKGKLAELLFLKSPEEQDERIVSKLFLEGK
ncbi:MAG: penicillin acylase family protein [bacterium]